MSGGDTRSSTPETDARRAGLAHNPAPMRCWKFHCRWAISRVIPSAEANDPSHDREEGTIEGRAETEVTGRSAVRLLDR